ncbi:MULTISPECIES: hypothetical protein [Leuconostoc]|nr:hypothetical protein [Leuconostoc sp. BM2]
MREKNARRKVSKTYHRPNRNESARRCTDELTSRRADELMD